MIVVAVLVGRLSLGLAHTPPAQSVSGLCSVNGQPYLWMRRNETTGDLYIDTSNNNNTDTNDNNTNYKNNHSIWINGTIPKGNNNETRNRSRRIRARVTEAFSLLDDRALQQAADVVTSVRSCPCLEERNISYYCESDKDICQLTRDGRRICYTASVQQVIGNFIPFYGFWLVFLMVMLIMTHQGRYAWSFVRRKLLFRSTLEEDVDRLILRQPDQILYMLRSSQLRMHGRDGGGRGGVEHQPAPPPAQQQDTIEDTTPIGEGDPPTPPEQPPPQPQQRHQPHHARLRLRTKRYHDATTTMEEQLCSICLGPLQEGMRVGSLACHHDFHVDCLKTWLKRKNHCPLCNEQAAEVTFGSNHNSIVRPER
jgi:Ring finger domain